jgi:hypothetical protein
MARRIGGPLPCSAVASYNAQEGRSINWIPRQYSSRFQVAIANARGGDRKQPADPKTNSGQGSKSALDEMKRRAQTKPSSPPPAQPKPDRNGG